LTHQGKVVKKEELSYYLRYPNSFYLCPYFGGLPEATELRRDRISTDLGVGRMNLTPG